MINLTNGIRVFDEGSNPPPQPGYKRDKDKPWIFHPILQKCRFREIEEYVSGNCGCIKDRMKCSYFNDQPTILKCMNCTVREE